MEVVETQEKSLHKSRAGNVVQFDVAHEIIEKLKDFKNKSQENFPKVGIFIISYNASAHIEKTISRIPIGLYDLIEEIFIFDDASPDQTYKIAKESLSNGPWKDKLNIYLNPVNLGYGGNQKVGYRYAINKNLDYVVMVHGDGQYAPEHLPELIYPAVVEKKHVVFGSRMMNRQDAFKGGMPFYKFLGNRVLTIFENAILGTDLYEFHSGYRLYSTEALKRIPIEENTNDFHFDTQIIIQCRALGLNIHEVPIKTFYGDEICNVNGFRYAKDVCLSVLEYRFHQLHLTRRSRYLVNRAFQYTRKRSPYSSHEQILSLVKNPGLALDLWTSTGFLTDGLKDKGVESVCVGNLPPAQVSSTCKKYVQADLENLELSDFKREFDYIILADVIEHVRNAPTLLNQIQPFLKKDGRIIVSVPNIAIWFYRLSLLIGRFNYGPKGTLDETNVRFYTKATIFQLLERAGYIITDFKATGLPFEVVFESVGKSRFLRFVDKFYYLFARFWPKMFAYQFVLEAKISSFRAEVGEGKI